jgi:hypothetical protein
LQEARRPWPVVGGVSASSRFRPSPRRSIPSLLLPVSTPREVACGSGSGAPGNFSSKSACDYNNWRGSHCLVAIGYYLPLSTTTVFRIHKNLKVVCTPKALVILIIGGGPCLAIGYYLPWSVAIFSLRIHKNLKMVRTYVHCKHSKYY